MGFSTILKKAIPNAQIPRKKLKIAKDIFVEFLLFRIKTAKLRKKFNKPVAIIIISIIPTL